MFLMFVFGGRKHNDLKIGVLMKKSTILLVGVVIAASLASADGVCPWRRRRGAWRRGMLRRRCPGRPFRRSGLQSQPFDEPGCALAGDEPSDAKPASFGGKRSTVLRQSPSAASVRHPPQPAAFRGSRPGVCRQSSQPASGLASGRRRDKTRRRRDLASGIASGGRPSQGQLSDFLNMPADTGTRGAAAARASVEPVAV